VERRLEKIRKEVGFRSGVEPKRAGDGPVEERGKDKTLYYRKTKEPKRRAAQNCKISSKKRLGKERHKGKKRGRIKGQSGTSIFQGGMSYS